MKQTNKKTKTQNDHHCDHHHQQQPPLPPTISACRLNHLTIPSHLPTHPIYSQPSNRAAKQATIHIIVVGNTFKNESKHTSGKNKKPTKKKLLNLDKTKQCGSAYFAFNKAISPDRQTSKR